jgi:uncharacterized damage-inducible protein DinB
VSAPDYLERLVAHLAWADDKTLAALRRAGGSPPEALSLYGHVVGAEHVWLARIQGTPPTIAVWPSLTLTECEAVSGRNARELALLAERRAAERRATPITYINSAGQTFTNTVEDIVLHVCLHGTYHRGQVARVLREGGKIPEPTDYIAFIRGAPTATRR